MTPKTVAATSPTTFHAIVEGQVQGVGFRDACVDQARALGLAGWVRNRRDGSVEVMVRGPQADAEAMQQWLRRGPRWARVERVTTTPGSADADAPLPFERWPTA